MLLTLITCPDISNHSCTEEYICVLASRVFFKFCDYVSHFLLFPSFFLQQPMQHTVKLSWYIRKRMLTDFYVFCDFGQRLLYARRIKLP